MFALLATWVPSRSKLQCQFLKRELSSDTSRRIRWIAALCLLQLTAFGRVKPLSSFCFHSQVCFNTNLWARSAWGELVTCGACNTNNQQLADVLAKKIGGCQRSSKSRVNQTTYTANANLVRLKGCFFVPSCVLCLSRPDCMSFASIWFEADGSLLILSQVMLLLRDRVSQGSTVGYVIPSRE